MNSITRAMKYRQFLLTYAQKYGVSRASRKYNRRRSYIYFWLPATMGPCNPWPAGPGSRTVTRISIHQRKSS